MPRFIEKGWDKFVEFFSALNASRKAAVILISVLVVAFLIGTFYWASKATYEPLATNLSAEDATATIRYLRDRKIPFVVDETGRTISVSPDKLLDYRLELASSGLAQSGIVGWEVFDKQSFGTTSTVQRINEQRALEGELVRTVNHIRGVERARVHLAIPQKSAFLEDAKKPTASVILDLKPGYDPTEDQVKGIQRLVAAAVKDLEINAVTIVSNAGKQLSQNNDDPAAAVAAANLDYQRKFEQKLEQKIQGMLTTTVGEGKVVAKINADFDFTREMENQTIYDGENAAIRTVNKDADSMTGNRTLPGGQPGAKSQIPGAENSQANTNPIASNNTQRTQENITYDIPKTTRSKEKPMATLKRLSVAVMVDIPQIADAKAPGGFRVEPFSKEKLAEFQSIVANAVGWDKDRDPPIEIKNMSFFKEDMDAAMKVAQLQDRNKLIGDLVKWIAIGLIFTLFFLFVVRPFIKWVTENTVDSVEAFLPQTIEELEKAQARQVTQALEDILPEFEEKVDPEKVQSEMLKEKVGSLINENPSKASQIVHEWIGEKAPDKDKKELSA